MKWLVSLSLFVVLLVLTCIGAAWLLDALGPSESISLAMFGGFMSVALAVVAYWAVEGSRG